MKSTTIPRSYTHLSSLAELVGENWENKFPTFETDFITFTDLQQQAQAFTTKARENKLQDSIKRENTVALKALNRTIDEAVMAFRKRIQADFRTLKDLSGIYKSYGLEQPAAARKPKPKAKEGEKPAEKAAVIIPIVPPVAVPKDAAKKPEPKKKPFAIPADNDRRADALFALVNKLSEPGNPYANAVEGLAFFQALQTQHQQLWSDSQHIKSDKATFSRETKTYFEHTQAVLSRLVLAIKLKFPVETKKTLREFGFLKEVF